MNSLEMHAAHQTFIAYFGGKNQTYALYFCCPLNGWLKGFFAIVFAFDIAAWAW